MTKILSWLSNNPGTILNFAILMIGIVIVCLDITGQARPEAVREATLALLALIGASLLLNQRDLKKLLDLPPRLSEIFFHFNKRTQEFADRLMQADKVWILSRTGRRLLSDYQEELQTVAGRGGLRLLFINPNNGALDMISKTAIWDRYDDGARLRENVRDFIEFLKKSRMNENPDKFAVRLIDYLPAWTLILIDPKKPDGVIYVELATYRSPPLKRPSFMVERRHDNVLFDRFLKEFKEMWDDAEPAWKEDEQDARKE